jgi:hypothetical protein
MSRRLVFAAAAAGIAVATAAAVLPVVLPAEPLPAIRIFRHAAKAVPGSRPAWSRDGGAPGTGPGRC